MPFLSLGGKLATPVQYVILGHISEFPRTVNTAERATLAAISIGVLEQRHARGANRHAPSAGTRGSGRVQLVSARAPVQISTATGA